MSRNIAFIYLFVFDLFFLIGWITDDDKFFACLVGIWLSDVKKN